METEQRRRIVLNVSGRRFEVTPATLAKIPFLANAPTQDCDDIFIERSPLLFEEVLALVLDEKHPFPARYAYELDWYGIEYDANKLYDDHKAALRRMEEKISLVGAGVVDVLRVGLDHRAYATNDCLLVNCKQRRIDRSYFCSEHTELESCKNPNCAFRRVGDKTYCFLHAPLWMEPK